MNKQRFLIFGWVSLLLILFFFPLRSFADSSSSGSSSNEEVSELKKQIKALTERLEQVEKKQLVSTPQSEKKASSSILSQAFEKKLDKAPPPELQTIYDEGFWFVGPDDKLRVGGSGQFDFRSYLNDSPANDTFQARRVRLYATGILEEKWGYMIMGKWDRGTPNLHFAWVESQHLPYARLRLGQFKEPYTLEGVNSDQSLDFNERSIWVSNIAQLEDLGVMLYGKVFDQHLEYGIGGFNGRGANRDDTNDGKEVAAQLTALPFRTADSDWLKGLVLSLSGSHSEMEDDLRSAIYSTAAQTRFLTYASNVVPRGDRERGSAEMEWNIGPGSMKGGMHRAVFHDLERGSVRRDLTIDGWNISASYLLTGEKKPRNKGIIPKSNFNPAKGGWGALEIAGRYEEFSADRDLFNQGFFTGTPEVNSYTVGLNWYLNPHMRAMLDYQTTQFDDPLSIQAQNVWHENTLTLRLQFEY